MTDQTHLTALLGSRLCHDLISPIGAIGNGVELLMMERGSVSPELALIAESVAAANARIRYFRIAFGLASADQRIGRAEILDVLQNSSQGARISHDWQAPADLPRIEAKLVFLAMLCCESALAYGGQITVTHAAERIRVAARAERLRIDAALWEKLSGPREGLTPAQIQFALLPDTLAQERRKLSVTLTDTTIELTF